MQVAYGADDVATAKLLSEMAGRRTVEYRRRAGTAGSWGEVERDGGGAAAALGRRNAAATGGKGAGFPGEVFADPEDTGTLLAGSGTGTAGRSAGAGEMG